MTSKITQPIAEFVAQTAGADIPSVVRAQAVRTLVDTYAVTVAGSREQVTDVVWSGLRKWASTGPSRLACDAETRVDAPTAALVNGVSAHCLDYDPISFAVSGFIGSALASSLSAVVDEDPGRLPASDVLTAYIVGWEAAAAIARGINPLHYAKGWHPTATLSGIAAALAGCRLLELDAERTAMAVGIAVAEASGVKTMIGNMTNAFHVGKAARNGVIAARLAESGFVSHPSALEAPQGFLNLFNGFGDYSLDAIVDPLGKDWDLLDPGPVHKIFPCCGLIHTGIEVAVDLRRKHGFEVADIRNVEVLVHKYVPDVMHVDVPQDGYAGKFSVPYCIAAALRDGGVGLSTFSGVDRELVEIGRRVQMSVHPDLSDGDTFFGNEFTEVRVETAVGTFSGSRARMSNTGTGSISDDALVAKVIDCFAYAGVPNAASEAATRLVGLDGPGAWSLW